MIRAIAAFLMIWGAIFCIYILASQATWRDFKWVFIQSAKAAIISFVTVGLLCLFVLSF